MTDVVIVNRCTPPANVVVAEATWRHCRACDVKWYGPVECWVCEQPATALRYAATTSGDSYRDKG